jgi:hypothetical protein
VEKYAKFTPEITAAKVLLVTDATLYLSARYNGEGLYLIIGRMRCEKYF